MGYCAAVRCCSAVEIPALQGAVTILGLVVSLELCQSILPILVWLCLSEHFTILGLVVSLELCQSSLGYLFCQGLAARVQTLRLWQPSVVNCWSRQHCFLFLFFFFYFLPPLSLCSVHAQRPVALCSRLANMPSCPHTSCFWCSARFYAQLCTFFPLRISEYTCCVL